MDEGTIDIGRKPITIRKRKHDEMDPANNVEDTQIVKIAKTTETPGIHTSLPMASEVILQTPSTCPPGCNHLHDHPQFEVSMASLQSIRTHLSEITAKNETIKATMQEMREDVVNNLLHHMSVRSIAIGQIGRADLDDEMRNLCLGVLEKKKEYMCEKEKELVTLEKLLVSYDSMLDLANKACLELEKTIESRMQFLTLGSDGVIPMKTEMPHMARLAEFTNSHGEHKRIIQRFSIRTPPQTEQITVPHGAFIHFPNLPTECRLQIWREAIPKPRILTSNARHNRHFVLLGTCHEARAVVESLYSRILSPTAAFPLGPIPILHANLITDTIIRDLTIRDIPPHTLFNLTHTAFTTTCHHLLIGLSQIKHLALAYDILRENGGTLFRSVQVCCPQLKTLNIFPAAQLRSSTRLKLIEVDSNLMDYIYFRRESLPTRKIRKRALRGVAVVEMLFSHALQYRTVFREYLESYGNGAWNPIFKVCLLARWNGKMRGWQIRSLAELGDRSAGGFVGEDGRQYKGFIEAKMVCGEDGEGFSRYDDVRRLFGEEKSDSIC